MDRIYLPFPPRRVVSLVPSITESLCDLGFGNSLVSITDFCIYPPDQLAHVPRIGGPKNPDVSKIIHLKPDIVFANQEENEPQDVYAFEAAGIPVRVFFPKTVRQAVADLWELSGVFQSEEGGLRVHMIEMTLDWITALSQDLEPIPYFCPIWQEEGSYGQWWMTFNADTYMNDLLRLLKGRNIFSERVRRYPLEADLGETAEVPADGKDIRYPRVTFDEILDACPEVILLPNEPYPYTEQDRQKFFELFSETPAAQNGHIYLIDGSMLTWPGTRMARALTEFSGLFEI
jgi:iron complex transport system substrate-binding protein